jgi:hypothetical protein
MTDSKITNSINKINSLIYDVYSHNPSYVFPSQQVNYNKGLSNENELDGKNNSQQINYNENLLNENNFTPNNKFNDPEYISAYLHSLEQVKEFMKTGKGVVFVASQTILHNLNKRNAFFWNPTALASTSGLHIIDNLDAIFGRKREQTIAKNIGEAIPGPAELPTSKWGNIEQTRGPYGIVEPTSLSNAVSSIVSHIISLAFGTINGQSNNQWNPRESALNIGLLLNRNDPITKRSDDIESGRTIHERNNNDQQKLSLEQTIYSSTHQTDKSNSTNVINISDKEKQYRNEILDKYNYNSENFPYPLVHYNQNNLTQTIILEKRKKFKKNNDIRTNHQITDKREITFADVNQSKMNNHYSNIDTPGIDPNQISDIVNMALPDNNSDNYELIEAQQMIPFYIEKVAPPKERCYFREYIKDLSETFTPSWNESSAIGRSEQVRKYVNTSRTIDFGFIMTAKHPDELIPMYKKLNWLVSCTYPEYNSAGFMSVPPLIRLKIGNIYTGFGLNKSIVGYFDSIQITYLENELWEISKGFEVPRIISITCPMTIIHEVMPHSRTQFFGIAQVDPNE